MSKKCTNAELVIVPAPGKGHLGSTFEFAKRLLAHSPHRNLSITILIIPPYFADTSLSSADDDDDDDDHDDRIKYIHLPRVDQPELLLSPHNFFSLHIERQKTQVKEAITNITSSSSSDNSVQLVGLVLDMFCTTMIDVANEFGVPSYLFYTSTAACLGLFLLLPTRYDRVGVHFRESDADSIIPTYINPVPSTSLPSFALSKEGYEAILSHAKRFKEVKSIFVNTFAELESHAMKSLLAGDCEVETPPVYAVGPLLHLTGLAKKSKVDAKADKIMKWLDNQPTSSVVLLCFGSMGSFEDPSQLKEIALGLERSGHSFLWSVRRAESKGIYVTPSDHTNHEEFLPLGFLERIGERGMICGWVPQVKVLAHRATGGFVSHCGWNSILESLWFGVPIATWPMYAEQQINAFQMVKDLGLAVEVKLGYKKGDTDLVMADEIERAVTCLMDGNNEVRKRVKEMGEKSRKAITDGGSSYVSFEKLMKDMLENISWRSI